MKHLKNQRGFSVFEGILVLVIIILLGWVGYYVYGQRTQNATADNPVTKPAAKKVDPYAGWKTYTTAQEGISFKYPADWKVSLDAADEDSDTNFRHENVTLTSPDNFKFYYRGNLDGIGGGCEPSECPVNHPYFIEKHPLLGRNVYLVEEVSTQNDGQSQKDIGLIEDKGQDYLAIHNDYKGFPPYDIFSGKNYDLWINANYDYDSAKQKLSADEYFKLPDVTKAKLILESLKYE